MDWRAEMDGIEVDGDGDDLEEELPRHGKPRAPTLTLDHSPLAVRGLAFACGGELVITGDANGHVRVWNSQNGQLYYTQQKHTTAVTSIVTDVGADERDLAASCASDSTCHVWEVRTNLSLFILSSHSATVWKALFSPRGGTYLATCSADHTAKVWDTRTGRTLSTMRGHENGVVDLAWSPDVGHTLATCSWDRTARLWNGLSGKCLHVLNAHHDWVTAIAFSGDGTALATCSNDCTVRVWNPITGRQIAVFQEHKADVNCVAFNGSLLASSSRDRSVRLFDVHSQVARHCLNGHRDNVPFVGYVSNSQGSYNYSNGSTVTVDESSVHVLTCCDDSLIRLWDLMTGDLIEILTGQKSQILAWDSSRNSEHELIASAHKDGTVCVWNLNSIKLKSRRESCILL